MDEKTLSGNRQWNWKYIVGAIFFLLFLSIFVGECLGWPFLAKPLEIFLEKKLKRQVFISSTINEVTTKDIPIEGIKDRKPFDVEKKRQLNTVKTEQSSDKKFSVRFIGGVRFKTAKLEIASPSWSKAPYFLLASDVNLKLRYVDLWHFYRSKPLRIEQLQASYLESFLERMLDGRASWQFSKPDLKKPLSIPLFGNLQINKGLLSYVDEPFNTQIKGNFSFIVNANKPNHQSVDNEKSNQVVLQTITMQAHATGFYRKSPIKIELASAGNFTNNNNFIGNAEQIFVTKTNSDKTGKTAPAENLPLSKSHTVPVSMKIDAHLGESSLVFDGDAADALHLSNFNGKFNLKGPSIAAVGDFLGVTLPTTKAFASSGFISKQEDIWQIKVHSLKTGASQLTGDFKYVAKNIEDNRPKAMLSGKLGGEKLLIVDLAPAFGAVPSTIKRKKVLPSRPFDLKALKVMNADVLIDIDYLDLNTTILKPLHPLRGHLQLANGILSLNHLDARTAEGQLNGDISLDGRSTNALVKADLGWNGVRLEQWIKKTRDADSPPYISGTLIGQAKLTGQGKSSAQILSTLSGTVHSELRKGSISHLVIEAAGIDIAQAAGVLFAGDEVLPLQCAVVDLVAKKGIFKPEAMVLDTKDSTVSVDGSLSLASEELNLRAIVLPKDFSPLTLRAPLHVSGTFAHPTVALEKTPIGIKLGSAILLGIINPVAAVIPLLDTGDTQGAKRLDIDCNHLMHKGATKTSRVSH